MKRYNPIPWESPTGDSDIKMQESQQGQYVTYHDHMIEVTRLQERIAQFQEDRDGHSYGDV